MRKANLIKIMIFCAMIYGWSLAALLCPKQKISESENRELTQKPDFATHQFLRGKYQKQYENYLNDQFIGRDKWVALAAGMQTGMGKREINEVYLGRKQYLLEKWNPSDFDTEQVEENVDILSDFLNESVRIYGQDHVSCLMIPSKTAVLSDYLPRFAEVTNQKPVLHSLQKKLTNPEIFVDLQEFLQPHGKEYIFYRTDHHWTTLGAYYAYQAWAEQRKQVSAKSLEQYQRETVFQDFYGTTYNKIHTGGKADMVEVFHGAGDDAVQVSMDGGDQVSDSMYFPEEAAKGWNRYNLFFSKNTFQMEVNTQAETGRTLLLVKDSFANCFVPFLTEEFDQIIMIDYRYGKTPMGSILDQYSGITDVLVLFNTEKFMQNTKLRKLSDLRRAESEKTEMEEFRLEDFLTD